MRSVYFNSCLRRECVYFFFLVVSNHHAPKAQSWLHEAPKLAPKEDAVVVDAAEKDEKKLVPKLEAIADDQPPPKAAPAPNDDDDPHALAEVQPPRKLNALL